MEFKAFMETFCLNYCSTTHKAQGEIITEDFTIYDWDKMNTKCRYTALSRAKKPEQVSFGKIDLPFQIETFDTNIKNKISGHLNNDKEKNLKSDLSVKKVKLLFEKQNGDCNICGCETTNYKSNDGKQFSIDRLDSKRAHTEDNIQLLCWNCNRGKSNRF
jgi:hypothetical protein